MDVAFVWKALLTLGLVLLYYGFSIGITFYNKWLTKVPGGQGMGGEGSGDPSLASRVWVRLKCGTVGDAQ